MSMKAREPMADCPSCDGYGFDGCDEVGAPYACYFCGCSGRVLASVAAAHWRDASWFAYVSAERAVIERARLGVPAGWSYYRDDYDGEIVLVPPRGERVAVAVGEFEDIPF